MEKENHLRDLKNLKKRWYTKKRVGGLEQRHVHRHYKVMTKEQIQAILPQLCYTKEQVDQLIADALAEARAIDEESMRKHNRNATIISMILGAICLALFLDGTLRLLELYHLSWI